MTNKIKRCPNRDCKKSTPEMGNDAGIYIYCDRWNGAKGCGLCGPSIFVSGMTREDEELEAIRLWNLLPRVGDGYAIDYIEKEILDLYRLAEQEYDASYTHVENIKQIFSKCRELPRVGAGIGCGICGGKRVRVRGRYPKEDSREVCPTCLADTMDNINQVSSPNYGKAHEAAKGGGE